MKHHRGPTALLLLIVITTLILLWPLESRIEKQLTTLHKSKAAQADLTGLPSIYRFLQLAGLNALLADVLWMKADALFESTSWWEMAPVMEATVKVDPHFTLAWRVLAWHYGWNMFIAEPGRIKREQWLQKAADSYQEGTKQNPKDYDLWWDACFFYMDKVRQYDKAEEFLDRAHKNFPNRLDTIERCRQRLYERTWQVDKAVAVIKDILKKRPDDLIAKRDLEWWTKIGWGTEAGPDINWRWVLEVKENGVRKSRDLPAFVNPFEGTVVDIPPWRDKRALGTDYIDPNWIPDLSRYSLESVQMILQSRPDLAVMWQKAHPEVPLPAGILGKAMPVHTFTPPKTAAPPSTGRLPGEEMRKRMMQRRSEMRGRRAEMRARRGLGGPGRSAPGGPKGGPGAPAPAKNPADGK